MKRIKKADALYDLLESPSLMNPLILEFCLQSQGAEDDDNDAEGEDAGDTSREAENHR